MYHSIYFTLTTKCNLNCGYCFKDSLADHVEEELSIDEIKKVIDHLYNHLNIRRITLSGGEPTLLGGVERTKFLELVDYLKTYKSEDKNKNLKVILLSNAILLTPDVTEKMRGVIDRVTITLDSVDDEILTKIGRSSKAYQNYYQRVLTRLKDLTEKNFEIKLHTVVTKQNINNLIDMVNTVTNKNELNIVSWKFYQYMNFGNETVDEKYSITKDDFNNSMKQVESSMKDSKIHLIYRNIDEEKDTIFNLLPNGRIRYNVLENNEFIEHFTNDIRTYSSWEDLTNSTKLNDDTISQRTYKK